MPFLRKPVLLPTAGLDYSQPSTMINPRNGFPQNIIITQEEIVKRPGKTLYGSTPVVGGQIMGLFRHEDNAGFKYMVRTSKRRLEWFNANTQIWNDITHAPFTGGDDDLFSFTIAVEDGLLLITNGIDAIRKWSGAGNTAVLGGSPPKAKFMAYISPYILLAHIDDGVSVNPWKVQWNDTATPETWAGGNAGGELLSDEPSPIKNIVALNEYAAVYKRGSLWLGRKVQTSDIFSFDCIATGVGLESSRSVVDAGGTHFFMGRDDFYAFNGARWESIGKAVREYAFRNIDRDKIDRCFAFHYLPGKEVWFFVVVKGYNWPTQVWKYAYEKGFWYFDTCDEITAMLLWESLSGETWDEDTGTWDEAADRWDDGVFPSNEEHIFGDSGGHTYKLDPATTNDNGVAVDAKFESIDFVADKFETNKRWLQLDLWTKGYGRLFIDYSTDYGTTWTNIEYLPTQVYIDLTADWVKYTLYFDTISDKIRFRFRNNRDGELFCIRQFYPYYLEKEEAKTAR
jgi:hypothetical protein